MASREKVGELIRTRRTSHGWTQEQLADRIHCSPSAIAMYESGRRYPKPDVIEALADAFNVPKWAITMTEDEVIPSPVPEDDDDDEIWTLREEMRRDPERRRLFKIAAHASLADVKAADALINALAATNPDFYDGDDPA